MLSSAATAQRSAVRLSRSSAAPTLRRASWFHYNEAGGSTAAVLGNHKPSADPEAWTVAASKNRGLRVPPGWKNEIGQVPTAAALKVERQIYLDQKAFFKWTPWKFKMFAMWGVLVPAAGYYAIVVEMEGKDRKAKAPWMRMGGVNNQGN